MSDGIFLVHDGHTLIPNINDSSAQDSMKAVPPQPEPSDGGELNSGPVAATSAFAPIDLPARRGKHTPPGFVGLDRVLDEVGRRMNPAEWGRLPGWDLLPFRYDVRRKAYRAKWGLRLVKDAPLLRSSPVATEVKRAELRACARLYRAVCERVIGEFEGGKLVPYALHRPWGDVEKIITPGIWATQSEWAFYAGLVVVPGRFGRPVTARVLVRGDDLSRWGREQDDEGTRERKADARQRIGRVLRDFREETGISLTKTQVRDLVESVIGKGALESAAAFNDVWGEIPPSQGGRPGNAAKAAFDTHRDALLARFQAAWTGDRATPPGQ